MHLAIIPDGNRRWAQQQGLLAWKGHEKAVESFHTLTEWCRQDPRVDILTVWCFSTENWSRNRQEVTMLMQLYEQHLRNERKTLQERQTRLLHSGRLDRIPRSLAALLREMIEETKQEKGFILHLALDYGGKDEILRSIRKMTETKGASEETLRSFLDHPELPDIDLIIRTAGEQRTSNFFLWQSAYAEWVFSEKLFPDFTLEDLAEAIREFEKRSRRFGG